MSPTPTFRVVADVVRLPSDDDGSLVLYGLQTTRPWTRIVESEVRVMSDADIIKAVNGLLTDLASIVGPLLFQAIRDAQGAGAARDPAETRQ